MKKKSASQSAPAGRSLGEGGFFNLRVLIGLFLVLAGVFLALLGFGAFSAQAQQTTAPTKSINIAGLPPGFDCSKIHELGIDTMENLWAGLIMIACGEASGGEAEGGGGTASPFGSLSPVTTKLLAPLVYGGTDVDLVTGTETYPHVTQSETFTAANPDNPNQIVVNYNDTRTAPNNFSGVSFSSDGGATFTRLNPSPLATGHGANFGDPVVVYNRLTSAFVAMDLVTNCGGRPGIGTWKSTDGGQTWSVGACAHSGGGDDRESAWSDNNSSSPFYGQMYVSWNDSSQMCGVGGCLYSTYSSDGGLTWSTPVRVQTVSLFIRDVQITGDLAGSGSVYIAGMDEGGGGFPHTDTNYIYKSTDGGTTWTNTYTGSPFPGPGVAAVNYFAQMFTDGGGYWRYEGWGAPAVLNNVVHYVYTQHGAGSDPGDVMYIRSTDSGVTFSAPMKLNTDATTRPQWEPNISVSPSGTVFATWYDARESASCTRGNPAVPCYRMYSRKSNDNGVTWLPDDTFSDVVSPLPAQTDGNIGSVYAGDYDYGSAIAAMHVSSWTDGRVAISGTSQQDTFFDKVPLAPQAQSAFSRKTHGAAGTFDIPLPLSGNLGIECRSGGATNDYQMIINFATSVTVGSASVTSGTGNVSSFSVNGSQVTVNLTGVTNAQRITATLFNVNDGTHMGNVPVSMGVLVGDVNGNAVVNATDVSLTKSQVGQAVSSSNFREDVNANGLINSVDVALVKSTVGTALPP